MATFEINGEAARILEAIDVAWDKAHVRIEATSDEEYWTVQRDRNAALLDLYGQLTKAGIPSSLTSILIDAETAVRSRIRLAEGQLSRVSL